jgi:hypothetical protein
MKDRDNRQTVVMAPGFDPAQFEVSDLELSMGR